VEEEKKITHKKGRDIIFLKKERESALIWGVNGRMI